LIPPLMVSSITSFIVARLFLRGSSIYTLKLERRGIRIKVREVLVLEKIKVCEVMSKRVITVRADMPLTDIEELMEETCYHGFPVIEDGRLIGMITFRDIAEVPPEKRRKLRVRDAIKRKPIVAYPDESVQSALEKMYRENIGRLPVVKRENPSHVVGIITKSDILKAYKIVTTRTSKK